MGNTVVGYPVQTDQEIDLMYEDECARIWERLNAPDPCESQMQHSVVFIEQAIKMLDSAEDRLAEAMAELFDTPMEAKVGSFFDQVSDLRCDLQNLSKKYERGERD